VAASYAMASAAEAVSAAHAGGPVATSPASDLTPASQRHRRR